MPTWLGLNDLLAFPPHSESARKISVLVPAVTEWNQHTDRGECRGRGRGSENVVVERADRGDCSREGTSGKTGRQGVEGLWGSLGHLGRDLLGAEGALVGPEREVWRECQDSEFLLRLRGEGVTETKSGTLWWSGWVLACGVG